VLLINKSRKDSHTEPPSVPRNLYPIYPSRLWSRDQGKYHLLLAVEAWSRAGAPVAVCRFRRRATGESQSSELHIVMMQ